MRCMKLKYHKGKKEDSAQITRIMKGEGCRSHPFHIKYKTTTPLTALMKKWPWTSVLEMQSHPPSVGLRWFVFKYKRKMKIHMWGIETKEKKKDLVTKNWNIYTSEKKTHIYKIDLPQTEEPLFFIIFCHSHFIGFLSHCD